jgi:hypothetical protein
LTGKGSSASDWREAEDAEFERCVVLLVEESELVGTGCFGASCFIDLEKQGARLKCAERLVKSAVG